MHKNLKFKHYFSSYTFFFGFNNGLKFKQNNKFNIYEYLQNNIEKFHEKFYFYYFIIEISWLHVYFLKIGCTSKDNLLHLYGIKCEKKRNVFTLRQKKISYLCGKKHEKFSNCRGKFPHLYGTPLKRQNLWFYDRNIFF